jgi:LytS/YehU family sensor histidine kinase
MYIDSLKYVIKNAAQQDTENLSNVEHLKQENNLSQQQLSFQREKSRKEKYTKKLLIAGIVALFLLSSLVVRNNLLRKKLDRKRIALQESRSLLERFENDKRITSMEMMALRSQMNSHFIFNCLNSINRFVLRNDTEAASTYLTKFSKLIRMVLENSKQPLITLEEDVKCLEQYIQMEQFRCKNAFHYYIKYHNGLNKEEAMIPPLLLQPIVENAIWHGVNPKGGDGQIGIEFLQKEDTLYCEITDNGVGRKKSSELKSLLSRNHKSIGLQITKERLAILGNLHDDESLVEIEDLIDDNGLAGGTKVTIKIFSLSAFEGLKSSLYL